MRRAIRIGALLATLIVAGAIGVVVWYAHQPAQGHASTYVPADTGLRKPWLYFYSARTAPPRALVLLIGNDVAFWKPHQDLAWLLAGQGFTVVGLDIRQYLATLPGEPQRDSVFGPAITELFARIRHDLRADTLPIILGGHSFGAEVALWMGWHTPPPGLIGILALNPRASGHLFVTPGDLLMQEASGKYSFSTPECVRRIDPRVRIAIVRSGKDPYRHHDPEFAAAGGQRLRIIGIPFAGHSLSSMIEPGPFIMRAVGFLEGATAVASSKPHA